MSYLPVDVIVDHKAKERHRIETLNLLAYSVLLVLVLVTTWFFKRRKRLYIHETGLAIIYGLVMGALLRYFGLEVNISVGTPDQCPNVETIMRSVPDDYLIVREKILSDKNPNITHLYAYEFRGEVQSAAKLGSQISYASVNPEIFFNIILPPIVLNAGLSLKRRHFFRNIGAIFSYAFIGTTISVAFVGGFCYCAIHLLKMFALHPFLADNFSLASCLYFGAIISPTDPLAVLAIFQELGVDVNLFALVFGESILNDAVSIVLTHTIDQFTIIYGRNPFYPVVLLIWECFYNFISMFLISCAIGVLFGITTALTTKFTRLTESPLLETSLVVLMSYGSFLTAEVIDASGIVSILLCGISQAHYTINNLSFEARERLRNLFEFLTFVCENFLFLAVGVSFWQRNQTWDLSFIGIAFVAVTVARALSVYPLTGLLNLGRRNKIPCNFQHIIAWGGAARGVISYSLAARNTVGEARRIMLSTTSVIVIVSVILVGGTVDLMLKALRIPFNTSDSDEQDRLAEGGNNPNWLIRPKRLHRSSSDAASLTHTPSTCCNRSRGHYHYQASSVNVTPVFEVEPAYYSQSRLMIARASQDFLSANWTSHEDLLAARPSPTDASGQDHLPALAELESGSCQQALVPSVLVNGQANNQNQLTQHEESLSLANTAIGKSVSVEDVGHAGQNAAGHHYENATLVRRWRNLDNNFIKPLLTNSYPTLMETLPPRLHTLARLLTSDEQLMRQSARN